MAFKSRDSIDSRLIPYEGKDKVFSLLDETKKPILFYYYSPGDSYTRKYKEALFEFDQAHPNVVNYMFLNCRTHFDDCRSDPLDRLPLLTLKLPKTIVREENGEKEMYPTVRFEKDLSLIGLERFLRDYKVLKVEKHEDGLMGFVKSKVLL